MSNKPMERARVDGTELEFEVTGAGEPVVLIHGALIAEAYAPLCAESALNSRYRLVRYHRRGYAGSSPARAPFSLAEQAADCRALLRHLGIERAHVVGHSSGAVIALRLALDAPEVVHSLVLLEPALLNVPSGALLTEALRPVLEQYGAGDKEGAADSFLRWAVGSDYRAWLDRLVPGAFQRWLPTPTLTSASSFRRADAQRITQPVLAVLGAESASIWPGWNEVQERLREWLPQTEPFVLAGANHALQKRDPCGAAEAIAPFLARHPMGVPA
jgi:pimeloyl-ACP methyl ester carboxylesterase